MHGVQNQAGLPNGTVLPPASDSNAPTEGEQLVFCFMQFDHEQMHLSEWQYR